MTMIESIDVFICDQCNEMLDDNGKGNIICPVCTESMERVKFYREDEQLASELDALRKENSAMYAALLEASQFGDNSAALRCKVELQRIARNEAMKQEQGQ